MGSKWWRWQSKLYTLHTLHSLATQISVVNFRTDIALKNQINLAYPTFSLQGIKNYLSHKNISRSDDKLLGNGNGAGTGSAKGTGRGTGTGTGRGDWTLCEGGVARGGGMNRERGGVSTTCFDYASRLRYASCLAMPAQEGGRAAHFRLTVRVCLCVCLSWWSVYNFAIVCLSLCLLPSPPPLCLSLCCWIRVFPDCFCEARRGVASTSWLTTLA